jgi:molybdenum cofactor biosynthesis enzyme MoaA
VALGDRFRDRLGGPVLQYVRGFALTTNGVLLADQAEPLYRAGLRRLHVHLDTLDRARFDQITRRDELGRVLKGLEAAKRIGFGLIKLNIVAVKNLIEPDIVPLARFALENGYEPRFIEFMPLDAQNLWDRNRVLLAGDIVDLLSSKIAPLVPIPDPDPRAPPSNTITPAEQAASASSPPSAAPSAATATASASPPPGTSAMASSPSRSTTSRR